MKTQWIAIMIVFGTFATAHADLQPQVGAKACVAREYTEAHMQAHPKQHLDKLTVLIENVPPQGESGSYVDAKVVGEKGGRIFANQAWCSYGRDGSVECQIDCDGGAFTLRSSGAAALFQVRKDYYFPLFGPTYSEEEPRNNDMIDLDFSDKENRTYKLTPTAVPECEQEWAKYIQAEHGC